MDVLQNRKRIADEIRAKTTIRTHDHFQAIAKYVGLPLRHGVELNHLKYILRGVANLQDFDAAWNLALPALEQKKHHAADLQAKHRQQAADARAEQAMREKQARSAKRSALASRPRKPCPKCGKKTPLDLCRACETACVSCGKPTLAIHEILKTRVCRDCQNTNEEYRLITRSRAKNKFGLTDSEISALPTIEVPNPHYKSRSPMKLVLLRQVCEMQNAIEESDPDRFFARRLKRLSDRLSL